MNREYNDIAREMRRHIDNEIEMLRDRGETGLAYDGRRKRVSG